MLEMKSDLYRKPTTSPHPEVKILFDAAAERGLGTDSLAQLTGYSRDAIMSMRRPNKLGHGGNPQIQMLKDMAQLLGYELKLVPIRWRGHDTSGD